MTIPAIIGIVVLGFIGLWLNKYIRRTADPKSMKRPRFEQEVPPAYRPKQRDLTLAERNARDQKIAAGVVKKWKKKGLV